MEAAGRAEPDDGRSVVEENARSRNACRLRLDFGDQRVDRLRGVGALFEGGEAYDEECGVGKRHGVELAEADDRGKGGDPLLGPDDLFNLARQHVGAIDRRSRRQVDLGVEKPLVFLGQKSARNQAKEREGRPGGDRNGEQAQRREPRCAPDDAGIAVLHPFDGAKRPAHETAAASRTQQQSA